MARRKIKEEIKKPDILLSAFQHFLDWIKANTRTCIVGGIVIIVIGLSTWGYVAYRASEEEKAQYALFQGIRGFQEYSVTNKADALSGAESSFKRVAKEGSRGIRNIAKLYLARIAALKGNKQEAKALYGEVARRSSNDVTKKLSETALQDLEKSSALLSKP
jgi:hypothetical protein